MPHVMNLGMEIHETGFVVARAEIVMPITMTKPDADGWDRPTWKPFGHTAGVERHLRLDLRVLLGTVDSPPENTNAIADELAYHILKNFKVQEKR